MKISKHMLLTILLTSAVNAQVPNDGIPEPDRDNPEYRLLTYFDGVQNTTEYLPVPTLIRDFGDVGFIAESPNGPDRDFDALPTFTLARWHWWLLGFDVLGRNQRQFSDVIGEIKGYQRLLGETPLVDEPGSQYYDVIIAVREYLVPFEPVTTYSPDKWKYLPGKQEQIDHLKAAVASINVTTYYKGLYRGLAAYYKEKARAKLFNDGAAAMYFEIESRYKLTPKKK